MAEVVYLGIIGRFPGLTLEAARELVNQLHNILVRTGCAPFDTVYGYLNVVNDDSKDQYIIRSGYLTTLEMMKDAVADKYNPEEYTLQ